MSKVSYRIEISQEASDCIKHEAKATGRTRKTHSEQILEMHARTVDMPSIELNTDIMTIEWEGVQRTGRFMYADPLNKTGIIFVDQELEKQKEK